MDKNKYAVLMAGGVGSRFWPVSTSQNPKQFHDMLGAGKTLIQKTFDRLNQFIPAENILILTNERYNDLVLEQLPKVTQDQVVLEPAMRNTAPCILYAALKIQKQNPDAVMIVAPSDHWIEDEAAFARDVEASFEKCKETGVLCTLGIKPSFPNTGYGYIEFDKQATENLKPVAQFREKPDYATAQQFLEQGNFLWNAGIFMWSVQTIVNAFTSYQPEMFELFQRGVSAYNTTDERQFIQENYGKAENISIDYAILERSKSIFVLPASFDWNDLGTWGSLYDKLEKNAENNAMVNGRLLAEDAQGNMIRTNAGKLVVIDGLQDYIVVDKDEVLMIYPKAKEQDIKKVVSKVRDTFGDELV
ncbi:mannose-1-phosphate guanylyltransferase [Sediminicola luteus]|uniref:mannose-1-phosphate guanylyltransferase n=1 Tax=Sediminicola luteus TaxID=319238 RepID=A0A2A4G7G6_9FLAO|nr:mannose-1-phosphate guanylyltransferase [Sediminicola luteus]PCE64577.1 mannose-1-phosphate guanylyltransferase [Sediminicola luteus]